jgi:signal transduction histidine kinase/ActR/RegA family two-component response regulator
MKRWFERLPIHHKLVVMALAVATAALMLATAGLIGVDLWRYRVAAADDTSALSRVIAENSAAAVLVGDVEDATQILATVRVRPSVRRACLYTPDGALFAAFARSPETRCPPAAAEPRGWNVVAGIAPVVRNERTVGTVYVERDLVDVWMTIAVALLSGVLMLVLAGIVAFFLALRLHRTISTPIAQLAEAARGIGAEHGSGRLPEIQAGQDEIGDLVRAFSDMLRRVQEAADELRRKESERELLLVREKEANRLKDEFLAAVSHELRTPLNTILGWVQILSTTSASEATIAKAIASISRNARAQTRVIEDLVDVSRIATGKLSLRFDVVDIREPVEAAVDVVSAAVQAKDIHLEVRLPDFVCLVNGDRDRLQQIVWNLLSNAVKFTQTGGKVALTVQSVGRAYEIEVADNGIGISPGFLPFVFDRFRQADGSTTREHGGLGLGLAIVKELTALHGGSATVRSRGSGQGASFKIRIPAMAELQPSGPVESDSGVEVPRTSLAGIRVLAVDDDPDALEVLSATLEAAGAIVRTARSSSEALEAWSLDPADILLCDLAMPEMDGFELLQRIRSADARASRVTRAIAVSAHGTEGYISRSRESGFVEHITKPFEAAALLRAVRDVLTRAEAAAPGSVSLNDERGQTT